MNQTLVNQQQLFQEIVQDIEQNKIAIAAKKLRQQEADSCEVPAQWLWKTAAALETNDWSILSEDFINLNFIGSLSHQSSGRTTTHVECNLRKNSPK